MYAIARPALFALDPERAHELTLAALARAAPVARALFGARVPPAPVRVMGLDFPNPVGLAAGLDKDGACVDGLAALGFGFLEVGTVTPRPQPGNPRPRLFRLPADEALINRLGFNNGGVGALTRRLERVRYRGILGINIGKNADTPIEEAAQDYLLCLQRVYGLASYVTVNISSPNTAGLRGLQAGDPLARLLGVLKAEQARLTGLHGRHVPLAVKLAPDLDQAALRATAKILLQEGVEAVIATNTTTARPGLAGHPLANEAGGLSGQPLRASANQALVVLAEALGAAVPIIGVGGILSAADAQSKIAAGASLVQLYTGLIYRGPQLVNDCVRALAKTASACDGKRHGG